MAHFAELDENNIVLRVIQVDNTLQTSDGPLGDNDKHVDGETYCSNLLGGTWKQTSINAKFRNIYAAVGDTYDAINDRFVQPQPYASWSLDNGHWRAPLTYPSITEYTEDNINHPYIIKWDEDAYQVDNTKGWEAIKIRDTSDSQNKYEWNGTAWSLIE